MRSLSHFVTRCAWTAATLSLLATAQAQESSPNPPATPVVHPDDPFIAVEDPMLAPVPTAPRVIESWRQALDLIKTRSPDLRTAYAQIEVAHGRARMSLANSLPKLTGTGLLTHQLIFPSSNGSDPAASFFPPTVFTARAELIVPLISARNWYDYATAKDQTKKLELDVTEAERKVIGGLAESIVALVTAERLAEVTRLNLTSALSTLELNKRREKHGSATNIDVLRAEQEVAKSRANLLQADEAVLKAREALGQALGYSEPWGVNASIQLDQLLADTRNTCTQARDITERADLRAARAAEKIAERNVTSVDYNWLPTLNAQSTLVYSTNDFATGARGPVGWSIGGLLSWPLYEGGLRYGEKRQNEGLLEISRQQTLEAERQARIQLSQAQRGVEVARQNLEIARLGRDIAQNSARLSRVKYVNGSGTSFDMIDTQRSSREAEIDVTVKEFQLVRAEIIAFLALAACDI